MRSRLRQEANGERAARPPSRGHESRTPCARDPESSKLAIRTESTQSKCYRITALCRHVMAHVRPLRQVRRPPGRRGENKKESNLFPASGTRQGPGISQFSCSVIACTRIG